jgi:hypothetical protein
MDLVECTCVFDENGKFCPQFSDRKECILVEQVILATGQAADLSFLGHAGSIQAANGLVIVDEGSMKTSMPKVYAGGDVTKAQGTIIDAVAAGRRAAASIDQALGGSGDIGEVLFARSEPKQRLGRDDGFAGWNRQQVPELDAATRRTGFEEICKPFSDAQAAQEAKRCLQCDLRLYMGCNPEPPRNWLPFDEEHIRQVPGSEGVFQLLCENHAILAIKGTPNLRRELLDALADNQKAVWFEFEEDKMYSKRESELIQNYLREHGEMPSGGDEELEDLF